MLRAHGVPLSSGTFARRSFVSGDSRASEWHSSALRCSKYRSRFVVGISVSPWFNMFLRGKVYRMDYTTFDERWEPEPNTGCWLWYGPAMSKTDPRLSYGLWRNGRHRYAHRVAYERWKGPIQDGLQIDHLCRVPCCVNPAHLEAVTQRENILRGTSTSAVHARKTHCIAGHPLSPDNVRPYGKKGGRQCRTCHARRVRERLRLIRGSKRRIRSKYQPEL